MISLDLTDEEAATVVRAFDAYAGPRLAHIAIADRGEHAALPGVIERWRAEAAIAAKVQRRLT